SAVRRISHASMLYAPPGLVAFGEFSALTIDAGTFAAAIQTASGGFCVRGTPLRFGTHHGPPALISRTVDATVFSIPLQNSSQRSVGATATISAAHTPSGASIIHAFSARRGFNAASARGFSSGNRTAGRG